MPRRRIGSILELLRVSNIVLVEGELLFNETNRRTRFQIYSCTKLYMFQVVPPPIIRSQLLYITALAHIMQV